MIPDRIIIGYVGEKNARHVDIDISTLNERFGSDLTVTLFHKRSIDKEAYPVGNAILNDDNIIWTFDAVDTASDGFGSAQIILTNSDGTVIGKSKVIETYTHPSISEGTDIPEAGTDWATAVIAQLKTIKGRQMTIDSDGNVVVTI